MLRALVRSGRRPLLSRSGVHRATIRCAPSAIAPRPGGSIAAGCSLVMGWALLTAPRASVAECESQVVVRLADEPPHTKTRELPSDTEAVDSKDAVARRGGVLSEILELMSKNKLLYLFAAVASMLGSLASSAQAHALGELFDALGGREGASDVSLMWAALRRLLALYLTEAGLGLASSVSLAVANTRLTQTLRQRFFAVVLDQDIAFHDVTQSGDLSHQLSQDIGSLGTAVRSAFSSGVAGLTALVSGSVNLYLVSPKLALAMLGLLPVMAAGANLLGHALRGLNDRCRRASSRATGVAAESFANVRTVRAFGAEGLQRERYGEALDEAADLKIQLALASGVFFSLLHLGINATTLIVCGYGGHLVEQGELTSGGIAAAFTTVIQLERAIARLSRIGTQLVKATSASAHIFERLDAEVSIRGGIGTWPNGTCKGRVEFRDATFAYASRPEANVLKRINLDVPVGGVLAIVGPSGSGKSTAAQLLARFYDVCGGSISIDDNDLTAVDPKWVHRNVGIVEQEPSLFSTTIRDNIRLGKPDASNAEVEHAARLANAHEFISSFPQGYDTVLGERGASLSGGQKQRVAIARVILRDPRILVLDEATSALDAESEHLVQSALQTLMQDRTTIIIAHRLSTVKNAGQIVVLEGGKVREHGTHQELMRREGGVYRALFHRQQESSATGNAGSEP